MNRTTPNAAIQDTRERRVRLGPPLARLARVDVRSTSAFYALAASADIERYGVSAQSLDEATSLAIEAYGKRSTATCRILKTFPTDEVPLIPPSVSTYLEGLANSRQMPDVR